MLKKALKHEINIFKQFNDFKEFEESIAFYSPNASGVPHWNLVYGLDGDEVSPEMTEFELVKKFYNSKSVQGYRYKFNKVNSDVVCDETEYFHRKGTSARGLSADMKIATFTDVSDPSFKLFLEIIQGSFNFDNATIEYFSKKMGIISTKLTTTFYLLFFEGKPAGTATTYMNNDQSLFMFNMAVSKKFQGHKLAAKLLREICNSTGKDMYTYSHNPIMRQKILLETGFESIGTIYSMSF